MDKRSQRNNRLLAGLHARTYSTVRTKRSVPIVARVKSMPCATPLCSPTAVGISIEEPAGVMDQTAMICAGTSIADGWDRRYRRNGEDRQDTASIRPIIVEDEMKDDLQGSPSDAINPQVATISSSSSSKDEDHQNHQVKVQEGSGSSSEECKGWKVRVKGHPKEQVSLDRKLFSVVIREEACTLKQLLNVTCTTTCVFKDRSFTFISWTGYLVFQMHSDQWPQRMILYSHDPSGLSLEMQIDRPIFLYNHYFMGLTPYLTKTQWCFFQDIHIDVDFVYMYLPKN